ncbi:MAG: two-component system sensor histidine kinase NtrB [Terriglobales bacterium]
MSVMAQLRPHSTGSPDSALLLAAVQTFPQSLAIVASGLIVYANPAWCSMFECADPSRLAGRDIEELVPASALSAMTGVIPNHEPESSSEAHFVHARRDGTCLHIEVASAGFQLRGSEFQVIHTRDVSHQTQIESQLRESRSLAAVGRLVGAVAHDFNNLLTAIMLYCDLLIGELVKDSRPLGYARKMRMAGEHGAAMVQQLLALARPSTEASRVVVLNDVVTGIEDLLTRLIGENIVLTTSLAADLGAVKMDPAQVQQILLNLVMNARDSMPDGGRITLATRNYIDPLAISLESQSQITSWVELSVTDDGCGMDAKTLACAFEPFFTTKKPGRGNGLGLASARRLAQQEGGTIKAESEPGKGARISLRLPRIYPDTSSQLKDKEVIS